MLLYVTNAHTHMIKILQVHPR